MNDKRVYFIYDGQKHVKIGISSNPGARLASLQTGTALKLVLLFSSPGTQADEALLHDLFDEARAIGEWFRLDHGAESLRSFLLFLNPVGMPDGAARAYDDWQEHLRLAEEFKGFLYDKNEWADCVQVAS